eukprot:COSAG05_NODE_3470_length_2040_cov_2.140134_2_plen_518_part_00
MRRVGGVRRIRGEDNATGTNIHIKPAEEPNTILHENIEYGPSERKRRKMMVNFIVLVVLVGSFLGIIFFNGKKVDQKYLGKCGGLDEPGTLLYRDQYYPEIDLCPLNFDELKEQNLLGSEAGKGLWTGSSNWKSWAANSTTNRLVKRAESGDEADVFNLTMKAYQICAKIDLVDENTDNFPAECTHPPFLNKIHQDRSAGLYQPNTFSMCFQCICKSGEDEVQNWIDDYQDASGESLYCYTFLRFQVKNQIWTLVATFIVIVINQLLKRILVKIVAFEKPHSLGEKMSSTAVKVFLAQTFNTGFLILIMNANLDSPNLGFVGTFFKLLVPPKKGETYSDMSQSWFANVGAAMCMTMLVQNLTPPSLQVRAVSMGRKKQDKVINATRMMMEIDKTVDGKPAAGKCGFPCCCCWRKPCWVRYCYQNKAAYHQEALDESVEGPEFGLAASYGEAYLLIFVTCIYSTGLPILMFFASIGFTCVVTHTAHCCCRCWLARGTAAGFRHQSLLAVTQPVESRLR